MDASGESPLCASTPLVSHVGAQDSAPESLSLLGGPVYSSWVVLYCLSHAGACVPVGVGGDCFLVSCLSIPPSQAGRVVWVLAPNANALIERSCGAIILSQSPACPVCLVQDLLDEYSASAARALLCALHAECVAACTSFKALWGRRRACFSMVTYRIMLR